jgi:uncharacterized protein
MHHFLTGDEEAAPRAGFWALAGLAIAVFGPLALASGPMQQVYAQFESHYVGAFFGQALLWVVLAGALACLVFGERLPLSCVGLVAPTRRSLAFGFGVGVGVYVLLFAVVATLAQFNLFDADKAGAVVIAWPLWLRLFTLVTAGVVEEALYRGYAIERLTALTGRRWLAAILALAAFSAAHVPFWGLAALATPIVGGGFFTLVYLWRRDLVACMVAHIAVDSVGLLIAPLVMAH